MRETGRGKLCGLLGAAAVLLGLAAPAAAQTQSLVILHDNDLHGHLRSFCYAETGVRANELCGVGGAARRATLIATLKRKSRAPVVLVDAGDTTTRGPLATEYEGADEVAAMNAIGYDLAELGNNEFKLKDGLDKQDAAGAQAALHRLISASAFPWLGANVTDDQGHLIDGVKPFVVRRIGRLRVAFLGLTTLKSVHYSQTKGLHFQDPVEAAKVWIPKARAEADVVVAVTHLGVDGDQRLAKETRGIDAIVGGDSHTFLYQPLREPNLDGVLVPIVQDGEFGANLGDLRLTFQQSEHGTWVLTKADDRLVPVSSNIRPDPRIAAIVEKYAAPMDRPVGTVDHIASDPAGRKIQTAEVLAAAWRVAAGADIGLQTDDAPYEALRTRRVTRYQVHAIAPFHEDVVVISLTGAALAELLQAKPVPFIGAVHITMRPSDLDPAKTYRVAMLTTVAILLDLNGAQDSGTEARADLEWYLASKGESARTR
jgi:5'-nucleotidase/UDP-sugar diphosphatase